MRAGERREEGFQNGTAEGENRIVEESSGPPLSGHYLQPHAAKPPCRKGDGLSPSCKPQPSPELTRVCTDPDLFGLHIDGESDRTRLKSTRCDVTGG